MSLGVTRPGPAHDPTWEPGAWRLDRARLLAAACLVAYAAALVAWAEGASRWFAALVLFDVAVMSLPWRVPRDTRSIPSLWLETIAYQVAPVTAAVVALIAHRDWFTDLASPLWYVAGAALGVAVVVLSGVRLRLLFGGELAFLAGPDRPGHAAALSSSAVVAAVCEEPLFRGVALGPSGATAVALGVVAAVAFVARHHLPPAAAARTSAQGRLTQLAAAAGFLVLTMASGSLYPAMLAHLVNNAPSAVLAVQRGRMGGQP